MTANPTGAATTVSAQAAYEAFGEHVGREIARERGVEYEDGPAEGDFAWDAQSDLTRAAWEAAVRAATVTAWRLLDEARAELGRLRQQVTELCEALAEAARHAGKPPAPAAWSLSARRHTARRPPRRTAPGRDAPARTPPPDRTAPRTSTRKGPRHDHRTAAQAAAAPAAAAQQGPRSRRGHARDRART